MNHQWNLAIGLGALGNLTEGSYNIGIGPDAGRDVTTESYQIAITDWKLAREILDLGVDATSLVIYAVELRDAIDLNDCDPPSPRLQMLAIFHTGARVWLEKHGKLDCLPGR